MNLSTFLDGTGGGGSTGPTGPTGPIGPIAGADKEIIFNDAGSAGASADFTWDNNTKLLYVNGKMTLTGSLDPTDIMLSGGYQRIYGQVPTTPDTPGQSMFIDADPGTGTGVGGSWEVRTANAGMVSGTTPNNLLTRFKIHGDGHCEFADTTITQYKNITDIPTGGISMFNQSLNIDSPINTTEYISSYNTNVVIPNGNTSNYLNFQGSGYQLVHQGTGTIGVPLAAGSIGFSANISNENTGTIELAIPMLSLINNSSTGHIEDAIGFTNVFFNTSTGTVENVIGYNVNQPIFNTGSINNLFGIRIADHSNIGLVKSFNIWSMGFNSLNIFDGKIGIGTVGPTESLDVVGNIAATGEILAKKLPRVLSTTSSIDLTSTGVTPLYTIPTGVTAIITQIVIRLTTATGVTVPPVIGIGIASGEDDIISPTTLTGLSTNNEYFTIQNNGVSAKGNATNIINLGIDTAATATTMLAEIDLVGYLI